MYVLNHSLDAAHSIDGLSIELRDKCQVYGPPIHSTTYSATWKRARISNDITQFMVIESLAICIFGSMLGCQMVMEGKQVAGFNNSLEWRGESGWQARILIAC